MQAIILAGGKGTRLKPFTASFPKPLVPVGDYPILEIIIRQLVHYGFKEVILSTGHLAQLIQAYFGDGKRFNIDIHYVYEKIPLGTAGSLKLIKNLEKNFLVMNGDILTTLNYADFLLKHQTRGAPASVAVTERQVKTEFGILGMDNDSYLKTWDEKPIYKSMVSMGVYALSNTLVELIDDDEFLGMPDLLLKAKNLNHKIFCHRSEAYWLDIGRVEDYEKAQEEFNAQKHQLLR